MWSKKLWEKPTQNETKPINFRKQREGRKLKSEVTKIHWEVKNPHLDSAKETLD